MRHYEVAFIIHPEVEEDGVTALVDKVQGWITSSGGAVEKVDRLGKKRMAYEIHKQRDGHYVLINTTLNTGGPAEVERNLRLNEQVLRFMVIRVDETPAAAPPAPPAEAAAPADSTAPAEAAA
jgi:small subunit ribosomal protein S6